MVKDEIGQILAKVRVKNQCWYGANVEERKQIHHAFNGQRGLVYANCRNPECCNPEHTYCQVSSRGQKPKRTRMFRASASRIVVATRKFFCR